jgi:metal-responsive CopG/Arc/MetJ family transcriptional regulator
MDELNSERIITPMPKSLVTAVDDYRFSNRMPSRAEAIRRLLELGLEAANKSASQNKRNN